MVVEEWEGGGGGGGGSNFSLCVLRRGRCRPYFTLSHIFLPDTSTFRAVAQLVEALRYKPEGRGFDSRLCHGNFSFI
jgi:hypothetical protein